MRLLNTIRQLLRRTHKHTSPARHQGDQAEDLAAQYLQQHGLTICERNYSIKGGEIDLIARDQKHLVFVEVRYRSSDAFGSASESVTHHKQAKLRRTALHYLQKHRLHEQCPCRFDIVALSADNRIDWIKDAF